MLDARHVRDNADAVRAAMAARGSSWDVDAFLKLDEERRALIGRVEKLQARRNEASKAIGRIMKEAPRTEAAEALKNEVRSINDELSADASLLDAMEADVRALLLTAPNLPDSSTPEGAGEDDNVEVRRWGTPRDFEFEPKAHWDLGPALGIIDFERAVKLTASRFVLMGGLGARLERALINLMLDTHTARGYKEWWPPILANAETLTGTGQLPKFEDDLFKTQGDPPLYLVPTAEVVLTNIHRDETLEAEDLPLLYTAFTPCFREEAGAAGRDTRGMIRVHQFDKVELVKFAKPEESMDDLESMLVDATNVLELLELPYRVITLCTGDMGFGAAKTYDLEVWLPSYAGYKEISSCSDCGDFQARRAGIRYRDPSAFKGTRLVHTLNGSGLAVGRTVAAIIENCQNADGSITVPEVLRGYMGVDVITAG
ncbi:MAG TPA: serine--tRNA ligase [Coriobacteriia bacterium]